MSKSIEEVWKEIVIIQYTNKIIDPQVLLTM